MENKNHFGKIDERLTITHTLRDVRKNRYLSQEQLTNRTGLTAKYISLIEKGAI